jgi:hypothetical protein
MMNHYNRENLILKIASLNAELEHLLGMGPQVSGKVEPVKEVKSQAWSRENMHFLMMEQLLNYSRKHQN